MSFSIPAPSSGVASLLSSQSHIPFGLLFNFQGTVRRSFTYSHWEAASGKSKSKKYLRIWKVLSLVPTGKSKIIGCFWKIFCFTKDPFTHLDKGGRNAHPFLRFSKKNFLSTENISSLIWNYKAKWHPISQKKWENIFRLWVLYFACSEPPFTYSHWEKPNAHPKSQKIFYPFTYLELRSRNAPCFYKNVEKYFFDWEPWFCLLKKSPHLFPLRTAKCTP